MKKTKIKSAILALVVLVSLMSYVFINTVSIPNTKLADPASLIYEENEVDENNMILPDVELIKRVMQKSKEFLPAS